ncbi:hypothetical protein LGR54_20620 [Ancylobacter sp. Lp-2]|uniref:hypothetical protein n=1 Tax=Ancylobacter sp. Lp-2 TaxID=2881339 RepID=UPI001E3FBDD3|nr:hypothetical protein [Ancylobacter sp. Lp-2]MCB4771017.1 hypothetical protein [Ancylobacter sp. Lp-2]
MFSRLPTRFAALVLCTAIAPPGPAIAQMAAASNTIVHCVSAREPSPPPELLAPTRMSELDVPLVPPIGPAFGLASYLSALETYIGITASQLDAWRAYTNAFQAALAPPDFAPGLEPPPRMGPPGGRPPHGEALLPGEDLARRLVDKGDAARRLMVAIDGLRSQLTTEQFDRLRHAGRTFAPLARPAPDADQMPPVNDCPEATGACTSNP